MHRRILLALFITMFIIGCIFVYSFVKQKEELHVAFSVKNLSETREKEVFIKVTDQNNLTITTAEIFYEQITQDFMYSVGEYWDKGAEEAGTNALGIYLDWDWGKLEPEDDAYNWSHLEITGILDENGELKLSVEHAKHIFLRLGVIATSAWIVGEKMDAFQETGYPQWIDKNNLTQVKTKYLEFVTALLNHLKFKPDFYMIEVEINSLGVNAGMTNQQVVNWLNQLVNKIKEIDLWAKVSIVVTSHDLSPFMEEYRANNKILVEQDKYPLRVTEFLEKMEGANYDIISVFIQPFGWVSKGDFRDAIQFIDSLCSFNKTVYIASVSFLAEQPKVHEELNPQPNGVNTTGFIYYPNPQASEEWQKEQTLNLMNYLILNPQVIGVHWDMFDYVENGVGGKDIQVKLATSFTSGYRASDGQIIEGKQRMVYEPMKRLWQSLFSKGRLETNDNGEATFRGFPGSYKIIVLHSKYKIKETMITI